MSHEQIKMFDLPENCSKDVQLQKIKHPVWTEKKAKLIQKYLYYFVLITKHGTYIDGFAGPQNENEQDSWSAKLVAESEPKWLRHFFLFDQSQSQYECLISLKESQSECPNRDINVYCGDFNQEIHTLLKKKPISDREATFCLLDQRTFECHWSSVKTIADYKTDGMKIELFYFLPIGWLDRSIASLKNTKIIEKWWGNKGWEILKDLKPYERAEKFCDKFKNELGYIHVKPWPIYEMRGGGRIMYFMIAIGRLKNIFKCTS